MAIKFDPILGKLRSSEEDKINELKESIDTETFEVKAGIIVPGNPFSDKFSINEAIIAGLNSYQITSKAPNNSFFFDTITRTQEVYNEETGETETQTYEDDSYEYICIAIPKGKTLLKTFINKFETMGIHMLTYNDYKLYRTDFPISGHNIKIELETENSNIIW